MRKILMASLLVSTASLASANIVTNGDFESSNIGNTLFVGIFPGSALLTGWTIDAPTPGQGVDIISNRTGCASCSNTNEQAVDMAGSPGRGFIYQDLTTVAGASYTLKFFATSNGGAILNSLTIAWDGGNIDTISTAPQGVWQAFQYTVTASTTTTRLEFFGNIDGFNGAFLDTVSVDPTAPEPASGLLVVLSGAALAMFRRNRRVAR
jgi:hypothetical protein